MMFSKILTENDFTGALMNILKLGQSLKNIIRNIIGRYKQWVG